MERKHSGKLPHPIRAPHFCGVRCFLCPRFQHSFFFSRTEPGCNWPSRLRFFFCLAARVYSRYLFVNASQAASCRSPFAHLTLWGARFLCLRLRRASRLSPRPSPNAIRVLGTGFLLRPASSPLAAKAPERQKGPPAPHALEALLPPSVSPFPSPGFPPKPVSGPRPPLGAADGTGPGTGPHHIPAWPPPP